MNGRDILWGLQYIGEDLIEQAQYGQMSVRPSNRNRRAVPRPLLLAALIALLLLLVGCAVAYSNGWFRLAFASQSQAPLSDEQIQYLQSNEQPVEQAQTLHGWTVDLKSSISDGTVGYLVFRVTAPENVDLEQYLNRPIGDDTRLSPGNYSISKKAYYSMAIASVGNVDTARNYMYTDGGSWMSDNDGQANTVLYCMHIRCARIDPTKPMLLEEPFGKDISFRIRFMGITLEYTNQDVAESIAEKYAGQAYIVDGEEAANLFGSDILTDDEWSFRVTFDSDGQFVELIDRPISVPARVWRYADEKKWEAVETTQTVALFSFRVMPFGAKIGFAPLPDALGISFGDDNGIYAVMKEGSRIEMRTDGQDYSLLQAQSPIVLSRLDYVLLPDGTKLYPTEVPPE